MQFEPADHPLVQAVRFVPEDPGQQVADAIFMSPGQSYSYLVASPSGDVLINAGLSWEADRHRERYEALLGRSLDVRKLIFTQSHEDHWSGAPAFMNPAAETIAQDRFDEGRADRRLLADFMTPRRRRAIGALHSKEDTRRRARTELPDVEVTTAVAECHVFDVGGRRFELHAVPGGETRDCLAVWLPAQRTLFTGNFMGALHGQFPNLYTIRGDRLRSARTFLRSIEHLIALEPELLLTGHGEPVRGADIIRADLTKVRDMVRFVHDSTIAGMNEGKDLWTLMSEIALPPELEPVAGRGPIRWYVRTVWEEYTGWFRMESTTELYDVPAAALWPEIAELAGGLEVLARRAATHVEAGRPVHALHLADMALAVDSAHHGSLRVQISALEMLIERTGGKHFDELCWLQSELARARTALGLGKSRNAAGCRSSIAGEAERLR